MNKFLKLLLIISVLINFSNLAVFADENLDVQKKEIVALYNANKLEDAYRLIAQVDETKRDAELWLILSNITQDYGNSDDSIGFLTKSIQKDPKYYKAYYNLGNIYFEQNKVVKAIENYKLALKYNKEMPFIYYNLGCAYLKDAQFAKAKTNFMKAISLKNNEKDFYYNLALTYKKMGKDKQAQKALDLYNQLSG